MPSFSQAAGAAALDRLIRRSTLNGVHLQPAMAFCFRRLKAGPVRPNLPQPQDPNGLRAFPFEPPALVFAGGILNPQ